MTIQAHPLAELVSLIEALTDPYVVFDNQYRILAANPAYRQLVASGASAVGRFCYEISHHYTVPCDQAGESCPMARSMESGKSERILHLHHTPHGEEYVDIELIPIRDARRQIVCFVERMLPLPAALDKASNPLLIGRAPAFQQMMELVARVAKSDAIVLLHGESGTGKELVAQALHLGSKRAGAPFIAVDCSGIPETLFESELFGHEKGAFTGASSRKPGLVEAASGGTLFLDEVGEIPLTMQVKLLRLLETGTYRRVGSNEIRRADIRIISATHRSLLQMVEDGTFRADLYYRLNVFPIEVPALRDRIEDIPLLVEALLKRVAPDRVMHVAPEVIERLLHYPYLGNVRELRNILERASLMCDGHLLDCSHLPPDVGASSPAEALAALAQPTTDDRPLRTLLDSYQGNRKELATLLGLSERTLYRRLARIRHEEG
jgi:two-component system, NtrC family, response regulator HydG